MVYIIAELGVNWRNLNEADEMIRECVGAGADAVKFQAYKIYDEEKPTFLYHPRRKELESIALTQSDIAYLYWRCRSAGVEFMCTPMYLDAVDMLDPYVKRWKIRCADKHNIALINKIAITGKPVLFSIDEDIKYPDKCGLVNYLACIPEYPARVNGKELHGIGCNGLSSHCPFPEGIINVMRSKSYHYLEVHVKRDHYPDGYCPIDNHVSITTSELKKICEELK